jgi:hypothetical protein
LYILELVIVVLSLAVMVKGALAAAEEPTEAEKKSALMRAYHLNGDSMVGWGSIDLSGEDLSNDGRGRIPTLEKATGNPANAKAPQEEEIEEPQHKNRVRGITIVRQTKISSAADICTRHHRIKVFYDNGRRWRCQK